MSILEDYKAYYASRMKRYENNPLYPESYQSEKALSDAMDSCNELEEFKDKMEGGNLNIKNGMALIKDKYNLRIKHYTELEEKVRILGPQRIVAKIGEAKTDMELVNISTDLETENMKEITVDVFTDSFYCFHWGYLEHIEDYEKAVVPDKYKDQIAAGLKREKDAFQVYLQREKENNDAWSAGWEFDHDLLWERRHREKVPMSDEVLKKKIDQAKSEMGGN